MAEPQATPAGPPAAPAPDPGHVHDDHHAPTIARNVRYGLWLFALYVLLYGGFMGLAAFAPERMKQPVLGGVNLAIVYGMGLIVAAFVLALVYMVLTRLAHADGDATSLTEGRP